MTIILKNKETLIFDEFIFKCSIGKKGLSKNKNEGDQKTPIGEFSLGNLYYRKDRVSKPETKLKCIPIKKNIAWCDDIKSKKNYNRLIKINKKLSFERLFRKDSKYDLMIPINYNTKQTKIGKCSAIFLHLNDTSKGTAGCISLKKKDFYILLKLINRKTKIKLG